MENKRTTRNERRRGDHSMLVKGGKGETRGERQETERNPFRRFEVARGSLHGPCRWAMSVTSGGTMSLGHVAGLWAMGHRTLTTRQTPSSTKHCQAQPGNLGLLARAVSAVAVCGFAVLAVVSTVRLNGEWEWGRRRAARGSVGVVRGCETDP